MIQMYIFFNELIYMYTDSFKILAYTERDIQVPESWEDSGPNMIEGGGEHVRLNPVFTLVHSIEPFVAYKLRDTF